MLKNIFFLFLLLTTQLSFSVEPSAEQAPAESTVESTAVQLLHEEYQLHVGKLIYIFPEISSINEEAFRRLSAQEMSDFQTHRMEFLKYAALALSGIRYSLGLGAIIKDKIFFWREKTGEQGLSLSQRSSIITQNLLTALDRQLWAQSPLVAKANEFGVSASIGVGAEGGLSNKGFGGQFDLGVSFAFNQEKKTFVFQIFRNIERFDGTKMGVVGYLGFAAKAGALISNHQEGSSMQQNGATFYPPGFPGYLTEVPTMSSSGFSTGLGLPPPPFGDLLTFTNKLNHRVLIRVTVSPLTKGFIRINVGAGLDRILIWIEPIVNFVRRIQGGLHSSNFCRALF